jgi:hypothetical protein
VRTISAARGIPVGAVHRAKRQLEKSMAQQPGKNAPAASFQLPVSYLVKKNNGGVPQQIGGSRFWYMSEPWRVQSGAAC